MSRSELCGCRSLAGLLLLVVFLLSDAPLMASELRGKLSGIAGDIKKYLDSHGQNRLSLGEFRGPPSLDTAAGPGIERMLGEELKKLGISIERLASFSVSGEYLIAKEKVTNLLTIKLIVRLYNSQAEVAAELNSILHSTDDLAKLTGATVSLPPKGDRQTRNEKLEEILKKPEVHVEKTRISARKDSPFAIEILARLVPEEPPVARRPEVKDGQATVSIGRDETYEIRIHNNSRLEAAVTLSIDGLDVFTFSDIRDQKTGLPRYKYFIVPPKRDFVIKGWHKTNEKALSFLVTEYGKGASSQQKIARSKAGVLTVTFAFAWTGETPPEEKGTRASNNETGFGPPQATKLRELRRTVGVLRDVISVRYTR